VARLPDDAIRRRKELTAGAWHLYELYCFHRNTASGLCNPSNTTLAAEMRCSYTHVSDCKTKLIEKGWIKRLGRHRVELLVGDFPPLKVRDFGPPAGPPTSENSELQLRKFRTPTSEIPNSNFGEFRISTSENSESQVTPPITPYKDLTSSKEPVAAAAPTETKDFKKEPLDEAFVENLVASKLYPPALIEHVRNKLVFHCAQEGTVPNKGRLLHWLSREREPVQPDLYSGGSSVVEQFESPRTVNPNLMAPNADCESCLGAGLKNRPCPCQICPHCQATGIETSEAPYAEPEESGNTVWNQVLASLSTKLHGEGFETWLIPIRLVELDVVRRILHLWAPNQVVRDWVKVNYANLLGQALSEAGCDGFDVEWSLPNSRPCRHTAAGNVFRTAEAS